MAQARQALFLLSATKGTQRSQLGSRLKPEYLGFWVSFGAMPLDHEVAGMLCRGLASGPGRALRPTNCDPALIDALAVGLMQGDVLTAKGSLD